MIDAAKTLADADADVRRDALQHAMEFVHTYTRPLPGENTAAADIWQGYLTAFKHI
jgi:hypothetical protein